MAPEVFKAAFEKASAVMGRFNDVFLEGTTKARASMLPVPRDEVVACLSFMYRALRDEEGRALLARLYPGERSALLLQEEFSNAIGMLLYSVPEYCSESEARRRERYEDLDRRTLSSAQFEQASQEAQRRNEEGLSLVLAADALDLNAAAIRLSGVETICILLEDETDEQRSRRLGIRETGPSQAPSPEGRGCGAALFCLMLPAVAWFLV